MISQSRLDTISTIHQLSCNSDGYNLYEMSVEYDYDLDELIAQGLVDDQTYAQAVFAQVLPGIEIKVQMPSFACSAFRAVTREGAVLTGRNYDFRDNTSSLLTRCSPKKRLPVDCLRMSQQPQVKRRSGEQGDQSRLLDGPVRMS